MDERMRGRVALTSKRGYGFITRSDTLRDVYYHNSDVEPYDRPLRIGDTVEFVIRESKRGPAAYDVRKVAIDASRRPDFGRSRQGGEIHRVEYDASKFRV
jgi:cold shock CspA family protein